MNRSFGTACKALAIVVATGVAVLATCFFNECNRVHYPARKQRRTRIAKRGR